MEKLDRRHLLGSFTALFATIAASAHGQTPTFSPIPQETPEQSKILVYHSFSAIMTLGGKPLLDNLTSGLGKGHNNPRAESIPNFGAIPRGLYQLVHGTELYLGREYFLLNPIDANLHGRHGFLIHEVFPKMRGQTHGCIGLPTRDDMAILDMLYDRGVRLLRVVPD